MLTIHVLIYIHIHFLRRVQLYLFCRLISFSLRIDFPPSAAMLFYDSHKDISLCTCVILKYI